MSLAFSTALCFVLYELGFILARLDDFKKKSLVNCFVTVMKIAFMQISRGCIYCQLVTESLS